MSAAALLGIAVFSGAAGAAGATIFTTVRPQWRRILRLAAGEVELPPAVDRWRRVHLAGDRERPFHKIRAVPPRRGLPGRWSR